MLDIQKPTCAGTQPKEEILGSRQETEKPKDFTVDEGRKGISEELKKAKLPIQDELYYNDAGL